MFCKVTVVTDFHSYTIVSFTYEIPTTNNYGSLSFGPTLITELSEKWNIPKNFMFIGSPGDRFSYRVSELGGVRLIM